MDGVRFSGGAETIHFLVATQGRLEISTSKRVLFPVRRQPDICRKSSPRQGWRVFFPASKIASGQFADWIKGRIDQYGFIEDVDFTVHKFVDGRATVIDYHLTIEMVSGNASWFSGLGRTFNRGSGWQ